MGWKNVKEHYSIGHIVQVTHKGICIGSPYIHDIIVIADGRIVKRSERFGNADITRYQNEMDADLATLRRLIDTPDTFTVSLPIFTYEGGDIVEEACEEYGYPNVTHAGHCMYENYFSQDKAEVIIWAKRNSAAGVELVSDSIADVETKLAERKERLRKYQDNLAKLSADYPDATGDA